MVFGLKLALPNKKAQVDTLPCKDAAGPEKPKPSTGANGGGKSTLTVNEFVARTKRCREKGLEPTKPELIAYARYLGIDPIADGDLMWIADEALNAPLPCEWTEHHDSADRVFYYNVQTHGSSWVHPLEQLHRDTYKSITHFRSGSLTREEQSSELEALRCKCEEGEREAHKELQNWDEHLDERGQKFYYNREQHRSVWTDPRPAHCHILYLQMKALRVLGKHCGQTVSARGLEPFSPDQHRTPVPERHRSVGEEANAQMKTTFKVDRSQKLGALSSAPVQLAIDLDDEKEEAVEKEKAKRKKKRREKELKEEAAHAESSKLGPLPTGLGNLGGNAAFDGKKPTLSTVEEVRTGLGFSPGSLPPLGRGPMHGPMGRLLTPPGDGFSNAGRAKVRAGIRLEPLR